MLLLFFIVLLLIPQTRFKIQVFAQQLLAFSPSIEETSKEVNLSNWEIVATISQLDKLTSFEVSSILGEKANNCCANT